MKIYIDISEYKKTRLNTGIQRVIKEFLSRLVLQKKSIYIIYYDKTIDSYMHIDEVEVLKFFKNVQTYKFNETKVINLFKYCKNNILVEIDSVWNTYKKRDKLYAELKNNSFKIVNLIYDLTPLLLSKFAKEDTKNNFPSFINAVYTHSDLVIFTSSSAKNDFKFIQKKLNFTRNIPSSVIKLGSDFIYELQNKQAKYKDILEKKYILFVGTIEPRKCHLVVLEAFKEIQKKHPDIHLVFIGKVGWRVEIFMSTLKLHILKDKTIHHFIDINDQTLIEFYKRAYIVTYISNYEGFGLPIAESLKYSNITITSNNSSMGEVGNDFVDYLQNNEKAELVGIIKSYLHDEPKYLRRKEYISKYYIPQTWDKFYLEFIDSLDFLYNFKTQIPCQTLNDDTIGSQ